MKGTMLVKVELFEQKTITLPVFPQMTVREITQFVLAAKHFHAVPAQHETLIPRGLQSRKKHLLLDYLLTTQDTPLLKIEEALNHIHGDMIAKMVSYITKRAPLPSNSQPKHELQFSLFYQAERKSRKETDAWECFEYLLIFDQDQERDHSVPKFSHTSRIQLQPKDFKFVDNRAVSKRTIDSYADMESILKMKETLICHGLHRISIFQELVELRQSKEHFHFIFSYVPSIPLSSLAKLNLPHRTVQKIIDKIWIFIANMRSNKYEDYLSSLVRKDLMCELFDKIVYDIKGNLFIDDFTLTLEEGETTTKMEFAEEQKLLMSIHNYFDPILDPQSFKLSKMKGCKEQDGSEPISFELFVKVFEKRNHQLNFSMIEAYKPVSAFFQWKAETLVEGRWKEMVNAQEASTVKKPFKLKKPESSNKKKKERNQSINSKSLCRKSKNRYPNISDFVV